MDRFLNDVVEDAVDLKQIDIEIHDTIDELKAMMEKRRSVMEKIKEKEPARMMSHELRTPLNAIIGFTELLKEKGDLNVEQSEFVDIIFSASMELLDVINNILEQHERMIDESL